MGSTKRIEFWKFVRLRLRAYFYYKTRVKGAISHKMTKFIPEKSALRLTKKEINNVLGFLQLDPKVNHFTIKKLKKQLEKEKK